MSVVDPRTPIDDFHRLSAELREISRRLDLLEAPSGTQKARTAARMVEPRSFYRLESPATITATISAACSVSVPVPDGYTRAIVNATAAATLRSNDAAGGWALLMVAARITPSGGASFYNQWGSVDGQKYGGVSAASAAALDSLTPGSTIDIEALASFPGTYTLPRASVSGSILFLR